MPKMFKESTRTRVRKPSAKAADAKAAADAAAAKKAWAAKQLPSTKKKSKAKASQCRQTGDTKAPKRKKTDKTKAPKRKKTNSKESVAPAGTADADNGTVATKDAVVPRATRSQKKAADDSAMAPSYEGDDKTNDEDTLKSVHDKRSGKKSSKKAVSLLAASSTSLEASLSTDVDVKKSSSNVKTEVKNERKDGRVREGDVHSMFDSVSSRKPLSILEQTIEEDNKTNMFDWLKIEQTPSQRKYVNVTRKSKYVPESSLPTALQGLSLRVGTHGLDAYDSVDYRVSNLLVGLPGKRYSDGELAFDNGKEIINIVRNLKNFLFSPVNTTSTTEGGDVVKTEVKGATSVKQELKYKSALDVINKMMLTQVDRASTIKVPTTELFHLQRNQSLASNVIGLLSLMLVTNSVVLPSRLPGIFKKTDDFVKWMEILSDAGIDRLRQQSTEEKNDYFTDTACAEHSAAAQALKNGEVAQSRKKGASKKGDMQHDKSAVNNILYLGFSKDFVHNFVQLWLIAIGGRINGDKTTLYTGNDNHSQVFLMLKKAILPTPNTMFGITHQIKPRLQKYPLTTTFNHEKVPSTPLFVNEFVLYWPLIMGNASHKTINHKEMSAEGWPWWSKILEDPTINYQVSCLIDECQSKLDLTLLLLHHTSGEERKVVIDAHFV